MNQPLPPGSAGVSVLPDRKHVAVDSAPTRGSGVSDWVGNRCDAVVTTQDCGLFRRMSLGTTLTEGERLSPDPWAAKGKAEPTVVHSRSGRMGGTVSEPDLAPRRD